MQKKTSLLLSLVALIFVASLSAPAQAATTLVGLNTSGTLYQIDPKSGALTQVADEQITSFTLGGLTRQNKTLYYVAAPSGTSENAIYTLNLKTKALNHVDLDRGDDVRALFTNGKSLYGVFYNGSSGSIGVYKINSSSGVTQLIVDLSALGLDPVGGSFAKLKSDYYLLSKPNSDSAQRTLVRFKLKAGSAKLVTVANKSGGAAVLCDRIQPNTKKNNFVCLASTSSTQVDVFNLGTDGKAKFLATLAGIERLAGGATMTTSDEKSYYALVYATGESNNQRLLKISSKGVIKNNATINTLIVGAQFDQAPAK